MITILLIFRQILLSSLTASILVCLILLVKQLFKSSLDARWHYFIWFLLLAKLLIPYTPESSISVFNIAAPVVERISETDEFAWLSPDTEFMRKWREEPGYAEVAENNENAPVKSASTVTKLESMTNAESVAQRLIKVVVEIYSKNSNSYSSTSIVIFLVWAAGCVLLACYTIIVNIKFQRLTGNYITSDEKRIYGILGECKKKTRVSRRIPVLSSKQTRSPSIYGILKPKLLLSESHIQKLDDDEIKYILLHELSHYKRKDVLVNWITVILQIVHWFNPIIWYSFKVMRQDCEIACDDKALSYMEAWERKKYGQTIINLLKEASDTSFIPSTAGFMKKNSSVKRRITMISKIKKKSWVRAVVAVAVIISVGLVGIPGAKTLAVKDEKVSFENEQLEEAIRNALEKDKDSVIYKSELSKVKRVDAIGTSDISELQACKNLEFLQLLKPKDIKTLSSLKNLKNLKSLVIVELKENNNLQELKGLTQLEDLVIYHCYDLNNIDILSNLSRLKTLKILNGSSGSKLTDNSLKALSKIPGLRELALQRIPITDLKPIQKLTNIRRVWIWDSQIKDLSPLKNLTKIEELELFSSKVKDISPVTGLKNLKKFGVINSLIEDISPLKDMKGLESIDLSINNISNINALAGLTILKDLNLSFNKISNIGVIAELTSLKSLGLTSNKISNIGAIVGLSNLEFLSLSKNQISDISELSSLAKLNELGLGDNQIIDISALRGLTKLNYLGLGNNQIIDISALRGLTKLKNLSLENNRITDISALSGLVELEHLDLRNNKIRDVKPLVGFSEFKDRLLLKGNNITDYSPISDFYNPQDEK